MNRQAAWELLNEFTSNPRLIGHALAVEACMRYYARHYGEDEETWGMIGLIHDFDYDRWPTLPDHPMQGQRILEERGVPADIRYTIASHASDHLGGEFPRKSLRDRVLFAADELSGLVVATALVRPSKSIFDVDLDAVKKKFKDKRFAAGVNRDDVVNGAAELGIDLDEHIGHVIQALRAAAPALGLQGV